MNKNGLDSIYNFLLQKFSDNINFEKKQNEIIFTGKNLRFRVIYTIECEQISLEVQDKDQEDKDKWNKISCWLFDDNISSKDVNAIGTDFVTTINEYLNISSNKIKNNRISKDKSSNTLFFANRMMNIFPELKEEIAFEKEHYSFFRGAEFTINSILPKILDLLSNNKDNKKIEKLFKLIGDLYINSTLEVRSVITMGVLNGIKEEGHITVAKSFMGDDLLKAWEAALKYRQKDY